MLICEHPIDRWIETAKSRLHSISTTFCDTSFSSPLCFAYTRQFIWILVSNTEVVTNLRYQFIEMTSSADLSCRLDYECALHVLPHRGASIKAIGGSRTCGSSHFLSLTIHLCMLTCRHSLLFFGTLIKPDMNILIVWSRHILNEDATLHANVVGRIPSPTSCKI